MANTYISFNGVAPTTAALTAVTTGTAIKTMLQLAPPAGGEMRIIEWGISFDGSAAATPIKCELIQTNVAATVTAHVAAGIFSHNDTGTVASKLVAGVGVNTSGYTATVEGTTTASRLLDYQQIPPTAPYVKQWPLGREPEVAASTFLRVRVTAAAAVNAICYVIWEE